MVIRGSLKNSCDGFKMADGTADYFPAHKKCLTNARECISNKERKQNEPTKISKSDISGLKMLSHV